MLGKTNITTLKEGGIVTDVADFSWVSMQSGVHTDFVRCIYENGYLVAIAPDGTIVWTTDGEVWNTVKLEYEDCWLNDIDWDGERFVLAGSCKEMISDKATTSRMIVFTKDFETFEKLESFKHEDSEIHYIFPKNGKYIVLTGGFHYSSAMEKMYIYTIDLTTGKDEISSEIYGATAQHNHKRYAFCAKNTSGILAYTNMAREDARYLYKADNTIKRLSKIKTVSVFECKGVLYYIQLLQEENYNLVKVTDAGEELTMCTGQNFAFVDGVYFNGCELFINNHEMLVVRKGESISDKTVDDLIEIAPEMMLNCITKAFGQLYIFGNQGVILRSSVETNNENVIAVQTLSAKKALADAKAYADSRYAELEARIAELEGKQVNNE